MLAQPSIQSEKAGIEHRSAVQDLKLDQGSTCRRWAGRSGGKELDRCECSTASPRSLQLAAGSKRVVEPARRQGGRKSGLVSSVALTVNNIRKKGLLLKTTGDDIGKEKYEPNTLHLGKGHGCGCLSRQQ